MLRLKSVSQWCQVSLSSLLPDWINLLFYLRDLLFVLPALVVWDHGSEFVNLLLVLPVIKKKRRSVGQQMCLHLYCSQDRWTDFKLTCWEWSLLLWLLCACFLPWWMLNVRECCKCVWSCLTFISLSILWQDWYNIFSEMKVLRSEKNVGISWLILPVNVTVD